MTIIDEYDRIIAKRASLKDKQGCNAGALPIASTAESSTAADYADDPMKSMARMYDRLVVSKGGTSIFACKPAGRQPLIEGRAFRNWVHETPHTHDYTPGPRPSGRPSYIQKPGRLVASLTGKLDDYEGGI